MIQASYQLHPTKQGRCRATYKGVIRPYLLVEELFGSRIKVRLARRAIGVLHEVHFLAGGNPPRRGLASGTLRESRLFACRREHASPFFRARVDLVRRVAGQIVWHRGVKLIERAGPVARQLADQARLLCQFCPLVGVGRIPLSIEGVVELLVHWCLAGGRQVATSGHGSVHDRSRHADCTRLGCCLQHALIERRWCVLVAQLLCTCGKSCG